MTDLVARTLLGMLFVVSALAAGCNNAGTVSTADGGDPAEDAAAFDGGSVEDAGSDDDAATTDDDAATSDEDAATGDEDAAVEEDASTTGDSGVNACADCLRGEYCDSPVGSCGAEGTCEPRPDICPDVVMPVCGCDGLTYNNACEAAARGQSVASDGACPSTGDCRTEPCPGRGVCMPCRGAGYICLPPGAAC